MQFLAGILALLVAVIVLGLTVAYVLVPLFAGIGWLIANFFKAIGWIVTHVFEFVGGMIGDALRLVSALLTIVVLLPFPPLNVVLGRWSAAGHFADSIKRECLVAGSCLYRILIRRPLRLVWLHGILEGVEQRIPEAMAAAPTSDRPGRRTGQFDGYEIVGSLPGGGSGAKLYVAAPRPEKRSRIPNMPDRVVIKSFALTEGSSLPQIVRESRSLESARQLGLVVDHGMETHRFFYVMAYHAGDHLGIVTRQLHGQSDGRGLAERDFGLVMGYATDLLTTLDTYHRGGLWHKDVKPDNVIINEGRANLVDLGLITPLRSAMTLTTHGTEYFRDPEMVRQALRGVKVHQVDGARFDIYAVGAVLYFMMENTFPAHGGLSRFAKKSPEALRWIVRRAMTDYNQRYESVSEMLDDLRVVAASSYVYDIKPADLPSMGGAAAPEIAQVFEQGVSADGPPSPGTPPLEIVDDEPGPAATPDRPGKRPRIRVTNWWTGAHALDEAGEALDSAYAGGATSEQHREFREESRAYREQAGQIRERVRSGAMSARRAAREQIKEARARAKDLQKRARARRPHQRAAAKRDANQPSPFLGLIVAVFVSLLGLTGWALVSARGNDTPAGTVYTHADSGGSTVAVSEKVGIPVTIAVLDGDLAQPSLRKHVGQIMTSYMNDGYHVVLPEEEDVYDNLSMLLSAWTGQGCPVDDALEDFLEAHDLYGVVRVSVVQDEKDDKPRVYHQLLRSDREGARDRRRHELDILVGAAPTDDPFLVVNDHPAKANPLVALRVDQILDAYREHEWTLVRDDVLETQVRQVLPPGALDPGKPLPPRLRKALDDNGLGGVLMIESTPGDGDPHDRIAVRRIGG